MPDGCSGSATTHHPRHLPCGPLLSNRLPFARELLSARAIIPWEKTGSTHELGCALSPEFSPVCLPHSTSETFSLPFARYKQC